MDNQITNVCNFLPKLSTFRRVWRVNKTCNHRKVVLDWNVNTNHKLKISEGARVVNINLNKIVFSFSELLSWGYKSIDSSRNATKWHKTTSKVTTQISKYYRAYYYVVHMIIITEWEYPNEHFTEEMRRKILLKTHRGINKWKSPFLWVRFKQPETTRIRFLPKCWGDWKMEVKVYIVDITSYLASNLMLR